MKKYFEKIDKMRNATEHETESMPGPPAGKGEDPGAALEKVKAENADLVGRAASEGKLKPLEGLAQELGFTPEEVIKAAQMVESLRGKTPDEVAALDEATKQELAKALESGEPAEPNEPPAPPVPGGGKGKKMGYAAKIAAMGG